jgi:hypothetical protein
MSGDQVAAELKPWPKPTQAGPDMPVVPPPPPSASNPFFFLPKTGPNFTGAYYQSPVLPDSPYPPDPNKPIWNSVAGQWWSAEQMKAVYGPNWISQGGAFGGSLVQPKNPSSVPPATAK